MSADQPSEKEKINNPKEVLNSLENKADIGNENPKQGAEAAVSRIEEQTENFLPEANQRIESEAKALGVTPEELEKRLEEQGIGAKLQEIRDKADQLEEETKEKLAREEMNRRFEEERKSVPESIMEATSSWEVVVRIRPDSDKSEKPKFDELREFLAENGYKIEEHPGRDGVPFRILAEDIIEVDDLTFAIDTDSPLYEKLIEKGLIEAVFVVDDANEKNLADIEKMEEQNEYYSKGEDKDGQTVHKRGPYLVREEKNPDKWPAFSESA
jgi:hypothetical protein